MDPNARALTGIKETVGASGMDASALSGTNIPNHNFLDVTRVGRNSETQNSQRYNPQELVASFKDNNAVGINPFAILNENQGKKLHTIG